MSTTAERQLIASLIIEPEATWPIIDKGKIGLSYFAEKMPLAAFAVLVSMRAAGEPIDQASLANKFGSKSPLFDEIFQVTSELATAANADYWASVVISDTKRRELEALAVEVHRLTQDPTADLDKVTDQAATKLSEIQNKGLVSRSSSLSQVAAQVVADLDNPPRYIPTPWPALNEILGGLRPGSLYIIGARPGVGKSMLALQLAQGVATPERPAAFYSFEMNPEELAARALAAATGISLRKIDRRDLSPADKAALGKAASELALVELVGSHAKPISQLRTSIKSQLAATDGRLGAVFIDYLQLIDTPGSSLYEKVSETSKGLKSLALEIDRPIVCLAQLNRELDKRDRGEPKLSDLRDSGSIEQDADAVLLLAEDPKELNRLSVFVAKNRQGEIARLSARVSPAVMTIGEMVRL